MTKTRHPRHKASAFSYLIRSVCEIRLTTSRLLVDRLSPERNSALVSSICTGLSLHSCLNLTGHGKECLLDIVCCLGRSLQKCNSKAVGKFLTLFGGNDTFGGKIGFVTDEEFIDIFASISVDFMEPLFYVVEGFVVSHVVDDDDSMCSAVVGGCDCAESFLTSCVPDLEFDGLTV